MLIELSAWIITIAGIIYIYKSLLEMFRHAR